MEWLIFALLLTTFENALSRIEKKLDLEGQPRVVVFHEKEGRRHAHCVWSRIDSEAMKAINISHPKRKLNTIVKELYLENGWELPKGFIDKNQRNPLNFTRQEWAQAQRTNQNPKAIRAALQESWITSNNRKTFEQALQDRGYFLAKGDKRGFVAVDIHGEVYSLPRKINVKTAELEKRLGKSEQLNSVSNSKALIAKKLTKNFKSYLDEQNQKHQQERAPFIAQKKTLTKQHRQTRLTQKDNQSQRWQTEEVKRSAKIRKGFKGLWDKLTGAYQRTRKQNEKETQQEKIRDRQEKEALISKQLKERKNLQSQIQILQSKQVNERGDLFKGMNTHYNKLDRQQEIKQLYEREQSRKRNQKQDHKPDFEPRM